MIKTHETKLNKYGLEVAKKRSEGTALGWERRRLKKVERIARIAELEARVIELEAELAELRER